jgi:hypothetical protein
MRHCDGRLFDGSACNNDLFDCAECNTHGCFGDGCDNQRFVTASCCGQPLTAVAGVLAGAAA